MDRTSESAGAGSRLNSPDGGLPPELFRHLSDVADYGVVVTEPEGTILYANEAFSAMHGYGSGECRGLNYRDFHPVDQQERLANLIECILAGRLQNQEVRRTRRNGTWFDSLMSGTAVRDAAGTPKYLCATVIDLTELKRTQAEVERANADLWSLIESTQDLIVFADAEARPVLYNSAFQRFVERSIKAAFHLGMRPQDHLSDPARIAWWNCVCAEVLAGDPVELVHRHELPDGTVAWFECSFRPIYEGAKVRGFSGFARDITQDRRLWQELRRSRDDLEEQVAIRTAELAEVNSRLRQEQAELETHKSQLSRALSELTEVDEMKNRFIANLSHELRTPLVAMMGYAELIRDGRLSDPEQQQKALQSILDSGERLTRTVDRLLTIARLQDGGSVVRMTIVDLEDLVERAVTTVSPEFSVRQISLSAHPSPAPTTVRGDREQLLSVLLNLLENAQKFSPDGSEVTLRCSVDQERVRVEVNDEGVGVPTHLRDRIFERFFQVDDTIRRRVGGSGIGLALVKEIIGAHGGRVGVDHGHNGGSCFWFTLPLATDEVP